MKFKRFILSFMISVVIIEYNIITYRIILNNQYEHLPNLFGFPFICKTSKPWVNSFEQIIYINGIIGNLMVGSLFFYLILSLFNIIRCNELLKKSINYLIVTLGIITIAVFFFDSINYKYFEWNPSFDLKKSKQQLEFFATSNEK